MLKVVLYTVFISLTGILAFFIYLNHLLHRAFYIKRIPCEKKPTDFDINHSEHIIQTDHGKKIEIWDLNPEKTGPIIIGVHGWEIAADSLLPAVKPLLNDWRIILVNTRNHGKSDYEKYSTAVNYQEDIQHTIEYVNDHISNQEPIILIGHSLGGAASFYAASLNPRVKAVISISAFAEMEEMMKSGFVGKAMPPWFISSMLAYIEFRLGEKMEKVSPRFLVNIIDIPVFVIHGIDDEVIDSVSLNHIVTSAKRDNVHHYLMKNHNHSSLLEDEILSEKIYDFLKKYFQN